MKLKIIFFSYPSWKVIKNKSKIIFKDLSFFLFKTTAQKSVHHGFKKKHSVNSLMWWVFEFLLFWWRSTDEFWFTKHTEVKFAVEPAAPCELSVWGSFIRIQEKATAAGRGNPTPPPSPALCEKASRTHTKTFRERLKTDRTRSEPPLMIAREAALSSFQIVVLV